MTFCLKTKKYISFFVMNVVCLTATGQMDAAWALKKGRLVDTNEVVTMSPNEHYDLALSSFENQDWSTAAVNFKIIAKSFPLSTYAEDAHYYLGISYFNQKEFDFANDAFNEYIVAKNHPTFFIEAIQYKFQIAEEFSNGATRRLFGKKQMPKWASGEALSLTIYDEVIAALPGNDLSAKALYSKASLLFNMKQYRDSVDALNLVIKRFPKNELAPQSYLAVNQIYFEQAQAEFQNPDILAFAELNVRRFRAQFPREEKVLKAMSFVMQMKELFAKGLYDTGQFYERIEEPRASLIYYQNAIRQFPETAIADLCQKRLAFLMRSK